MVQTWNLSINPSLVGSSNTRRSSSTGCSVKTRWVLQLQGFLLAKCEQPSISGWSGIDEVVMASAEKADNLPKYPVGFFDDLIGEYVYVACNSWPTEFAEKKWGPEFNSKTTPGEIRLVKYSKTGAPRFIIRFQEINQLVQGLDLDYVLKYSIAIDLPLK